MTELSGNIARPDGQCVRGRVSFSDRIVSVEANSSAGSDLILPGFVDLQVNGSHGIDVMAASSESIIELGRHLAARGTTAFLPTVVTSPIDRIVRAHDAIAGAIDAQSRDEARQGAATVLGMHLEGPFISPARLGAHPKRNLEPHGPEFEQIAQLKHLRLLTIAPELPEALDAIRALVARGCVVSLGHSDATLEQAEAGLAAGARMFTHLFNAMRPLHHREPGIIAAALRRMDAMVGVIPDGIHVHPAILDLIYRARGASGIILTPDMVALAGSPEGTVIGRARIEGGVARLPDGTIAGATISTIDGVRMMIEKIGASVGAAALMAATNPARLLGLTDCGAIDPGTRADLVVLDDELKLKSVFIAGREIA
jgi:N-acetylglucosamine-6-phosphate deacetylase